MITHLPLWIRFPLLPVEYYSRQWLHRAGNHIGKTLKVDTTTLLASRGRFARVCVEVDLTQPLKSSYRFKSITWRVQYEGLQVVGYYCGRYGHGDSTFPTKQTASTSQLEAAAHPAAHTSATEGGQSSIPPVIQNQHMDHLTVNRSSPAVDANQNYGDWLLTDRR